MKWKKRRRQHRRRDDVGQDNLKAASLRSNNISAPRKNDTMPPPVKMPCVGEHVHDEQRHRQTNQSQPCRVHGQNRRHVKHEDQRNRAHVPGRIAPIAYSPIIRKSR
jgi:hypothetical protein